MAKKVVAFVQNEGHCRIPQNYEEDPSLVIGGKTDEAKKERDARQKEKGGFMNQIGFLWEVKGRHDRKAGTK
jgi:hypothetical protein